MNWAHWHMILVHFPIAGCIFAIALMIGTRLYGGPAVNKLAYLVVVLVALSAFPAASSGCPSIEQLEPVSGELQRYIDNHAMISLVATWILQAAAILALGSLVNLHRGGRLPGWLWGTTLGVLLVATYFMAWGASLGGEVVHLEIRGHQILPAPEL